MITLELAHVQREESSTNPFCPSGLAPGTTLPLLFAHSNCIFPFPILQRRLEEDAPKHGVLQKSNKTKRQEKHISVLNSLPTFHLLSEIRLTNPLTLQVEEL